MQEHLMLVSFPWGSNEIMQLPLLWDFMPLHVH